MATDAELKAVLDTDDAGLARILTAYGKHLGLTRIVSAEVQEVLEEVNQVNVVVTAYSPEVTAARDATNDELTTALKKAATSVVFETEKQTFDASATKFVLAAL